MTYVIGSKTLGDARNKADFLRRESAKGGHGSDSVEHKDLGTGASGDSYLVEPTLNTTIASGRNPDVTSIYRRPEWGPTGIGEAYVIHLPGDVYYYYNDDMSTNVFFPSIGMIWDYSVEKHQLTSRKYSAEMIPAWFVYGSVQDAFTMLHGIGVVYNGKETYGRNSLSFLFSLSGNYFNWYDSTNTKWYVSRSQGLGLVLGTDARILYEMPWLLNGKKVYHGKRDDDSFWWAWYDGTDYILSKMCGNKREQWVLDDPSVTGGSGSYKGDAWWSGTSFSGSFNARGSLRGTTEGGYATTLSAAYEDDYFMKTGASRFGVYTGYGTNAGKYMHIGARKFLLTQSGVSGADNLNTLQFIPDNYIYHNSTTIHGGGSHKVSSGTANYKSTYTISDDGCHDSLVFHDRRTSCMEDCLIWL